MIGSRLSWLGLMVVAAACGGTADDADDTPTPTPGVEILEPADGSDVTGPDVTVVMRAIGIDIVPAGTDQPNSGHFHLFLDHPVTPEGEVVPTAPGSVHLGLAQDRHTFAGLEPGTHEVVVVIGDYQHVRLTGVRADTVRFTVRAP